MTRNLSFLLFAAVLFVLQGCASTLTKGADRRTQGSFIEDGTIEDTATDRIKNKYADKVHVNVNSYNRKVLVTGEVVDESVKADISRIIGGVQNVSEINNELTVGPLTGLSSRSSDTLTTSNVMFRMRDSGKDFFRAERVKVVTEHDTVYLLGLVTHAEADIAKEIASTSRGVKKVVPLFEYID
jgi:osmotically-inducible protein OsmY